jgi:hypothetical protein
VGWLWPHLQALLRTFESLGGDLKLLTGSSDACIVCLGALSEGEWARPDSVCAALGRGLAPRGDMRVGSRRAG